jgi:hypothetical protein
LRILRSPYRFTDVALLVRAGILAICAGEVHLGSRDQGMLPDLVTPRLAVNCPASSTQIAAELAELAWHAASGVV